MPVRFNVLVIHYSELRLRKPRNGEHGCSTPEQALAVSRTMAGRWSDQDIAASNFASRHLDIDHDLGDQGRTSWRIVVRVSGNPVKVGTHMVSIGPPLGSSRSRPRSTRSSAVCHALSS
jgi:hypothetical protein